MDNTPEINELADRLVEYDIAFIRNMHQVAGDRIDAFNFSEDWGTETDLMVSPETFRSFFFPRYKRIFDAAHECGWYVWMHSCGKINKAHPAAHRGRRVDAEHAAAARQRHRRNRQAVRRQGVLSRRSATSRRPCRAATAR